MIKAGLGPLNYMEWFQTLLWIEEMQMEIDIRYYSMPEARLKEVSPSQFSGARCVELEVNCTMDDLIVYYFEVVRFYRLLSTFLLSTMYGFISHRVVYNVLKRISFVSLWPVFSSTVYIIQSFGILPCLIDIE